MKKIIPILILLSIKFLMGCTSGPSPLDSSCVSINLDIKIQNKNLGIDYTGDSINLPNIKYDKDSIKYTIQSIADTSAMLNPRINMAGYNVYNITHFLDNKIGLFNVILFLNSIERDTIVINVLNNTNFKYYYHDTLINKNISCGYLNFTIQK